MIYKENDLVKYAAPIGKTEKEKCKRAIEMIRDALSNYTADASGILPFENSDSYYLGMYNRYTPNERIKILVQGSYANNTNIKEDSDVDVAVILEDPFWSEYRPGVSASMYGFTNSNRTLKSFKNEVEKDLRDKFRTGVKRGDKSIKVNGNTYRVDADVVPCGRFRDYRSDFSFSQNNYRGGIQLEPDSGGVIINYPEQHIRNGISKNLETNFTFKKMVRILKHIRGDMEPIYPSAKKVGSFQLESLIWNVPNDIFKKYSSILRYTFDELLSYLYKNKAQFSGFKEANGIKLLFPNKEILDLYNIFITNLKEYYSYRLVE